MNVPSPMAAGHRKWKTRGRRTSRVPQLKRATDGFFSILSGSPRTRSRLSAFLPYRVLIFSDESLFGVLEVIERHGIAVSLGVSALMAAALVGLWAYMNRYEPAMTQLVDDEAVDRYLEETWEPSVRDSASRIEPTIRLRTGIFVSSLKFFDSSEVKVTGYIWQRFVDGVHDTIQEGFVLPEQVDSGSDIEPREVYRVRNGNEEVVGWYFEALLRQPFEYSTYPFDHKTVWVRLWPREFSRNIVLVPDFASYDATGLDDIFGIDREIVLGAWDRANTFFDYQPSSYSTNFGIANYMGQTDFPELRYNFVIKRKFGDAFIVHLLPLLLVAALLYGALLTVSDNPEISDRLGFNASGVIASCSALFFVVLLSHLQLREQFAGSQIVYMEYFYFLLYGLLVAGSAYSYLYAAREVRWIGFLHHQDNLVVKLIYWPVVLTAMVLITLVVVLTHAD